MVAKEKKLYKIIERNKWGARPPKSSPVWMDDPDESYLHHTAGHFDEPDAPKPEGHKQPKWYHRLFASAANAYWRGIQNYHMDVREYQDVAYNFGFIKMYGLRKMRIYVLRGHNAVGGHTLGYNSKGYGYCLAGNFNEDNLRPRDLRAIRQFFDDECARDYLRGPRTKHPSAGHRDVSTLGTSCPGNHAYNQMKLMRKPLPKQERGI